jgi:alpha-1,3-rhamnosyl/mannosyltransferase
MLKVAIDLRWAQGDVPGGVGRGLLSLVPRVSNTVEVVGLADPRLGPLPLEVETRWLRLPVRTPAAVWLETCVPLALRGFRGVFHSPFYLLPQILPVPSLVTLHDITFESHRHLLRGVKGAFWRMRARRASRVASLVLTDSEWSRTEIVERYRVEPHRINVVPHGVERSFMPLGPADKPLLEEYLRIHGVQPPYLLVLGGAPRRGAAIAIDAWRELRQMGFRHELVVLGEHGPVESGLTRLHDVPDDVYRLLLAGADLLLYPTEVEGFGLPGLEAAACGTPPVCPRVGSLPEVLGDGAAWCARDYRSICEKAARVLSDPSAMASLVAAGRRITAYWSWELAAERLIEAYQKVAAMELVDS